MNTEMKQAKKRVRKRWPYAVAVQQDPFYGWSILVSKMTATAIVMKKKTEEAAWLAAADAAKGPP